MSLFEEARSVLAALDGAGIRAVALKGLSMHARGLYAGPAERPMNDVDLLVRPGQAPAAIDLLLALGYLPHHPALAGQRYLGAGTPNLNRRLLKAYLDAAGDLNFMHVERPWTWIDLHWDLARCDRFRGSIRMSAEEVVEAADRDFCASEPEAPPTVRAGSSLRPDGRGLETPPTRGATDLRHVPSGLGQSPPFPGVGAGGPSHIGFPVLVPRVDHEILYLAAHYAIFCRAASAQTLEDLRRLLGNAHDPMEVRALARRWGVARALRRTLQDLSAAGKTPNAQLRTPNDLTRLSPASAFPFGVRSLELGVLYEPAMLDTWRDRARWTRQVLFPSPAWLAFAYGEAGPTRLRHALALGRRTLGTGHA